MEPTMNHGCAVQPSKEKIEAALRQYARKLDEMANVIAQDPVKGSGRE